MDFEHRREASGSFRNKLFTSFSSTPGTLCAEVSAHLKGVACNNPTVRWLNTKILCIWKHVSVEE